MSERKEKGVTTEELLPKLNQPMPFSDEAEKGVLSCLLQEPAERVVETRMVLPPEAFYHPGNRLMYELMIECEQKGLPFDPPSLTHLLRDRGLLDQAGGAAAVSELFGFVPIASHYPYYTQIVRDKWMLRQSIHASTLNLHEAFAHQDHGDEETVGGLLSRAESRTFQVLDAFQGKGTGARIVDSKEMVGEWLDAFQTICDNRGKVLGVRTGWVDVDRTFHGLNPDGQGELLMIGGFPGMGKTGAAVSLLESMAVDQGVACGVFPLEMGKVGWGHRLVLGRAGVDISVSRNGHLAREALGAIAQAQKDFAAAPIFWDDSSFCDCDEFRARVTMMVRRHGVKVVFIDHFGQLRPSTKEGKGDKVRGQIEIMETLHELRRTLGITIVLFVQLTKEGREKQERNKAPGNGDVKGAGEMIEYPTMVAFIHRPVVVRPWAALNEETQERWQQVTDMYRRDFPEAWHDGRGLPAEVYAYQRDYEEHARFIITKNRNGATPDDIVLRYRMNLQRFQGRTLKMYSNNPKFKQVVLGGF
jgi:replicative DNA helicase